MSVQALDELKQQIPLLDYLQAQDWQPTRQLSRGRWMGLCPLHCDRKPSFLVDSSKSLFYCNGCGRGGDVIRFAQDYHQVKFLQAVARLYQWRGLAPLVHEAADFYRMQLHRHGEAVEYLQQRGVRGILIVVNTTASQTCRIASILMWCAACFAQKLDLTPLLPGPTPATQAIREAVMAGDIAGAAHLAGSLDPETRELWRGILAIVRNDPATAIRALRHAGQPKTLGVAYYLARQHLLFRDQMAEAIRRDPSDFGPYYYLGRHYDSDLDDAEQAARWFREALKRNPNYARARSHLGNCLERVGRTEEAEAAYKASANLPSSQLGLARLMLAAGDSASALSFVEKAMAGDPGDSAALKLAARAYTNLNRPRDAARALESAAVLDPRDASTQYQLYKAYQSLGDPVKAASALRQFERLKAVYGLQPR